MRKRVRPVMRAGSWAGRWALAGLFLGLFLGSGVSHAQESPDANDWRISLETVFPEQAPANAYVEELVLALQRENGPGAPVSLEELQECIRRCDPVVYVQQLIKYATPSSVELQMQEQLKYAKALMRDERLQAGVRFLREQKPLLDRAEAEYGVAPKDIVSILMWESGLGNVAGDYFVFNIFMGQILYLEHARDVAVRKTARGTEPPGAAQGKERERLDRIRRRAAENLASLLRHAKQQGTDPLAQVGSWGGAIGYTQFLPSSLVYAADGDGDGRVDLNSWPDAISSVARYLHEHGYAESVELRRKGIHAYNPIDTYVSGVIGYADAIGHRYAESMR
ncbi:MAG: lytic murein transglycosylase [Candidatus Eisenbacteria bacterium]|nr:lytic murein transglycosylase [Candidatus Eisenbacteria bacterium]